MLTLSPSLRNGLWQCADWSQLIRERAEKLVGREYGFDSPEQAAEWAELAESVVPDRRVAIKLYTYAWCGRPKLEWIRRARSIALELGEFRRVAELAGLEYEHRPSAKLLVLQGLAYLDADHPELALAPLAAAIKFMKDAPTLSYLHAACAEQFDTLSQALQELKAAVSAKSDPVASSALLLDIARLVRLYSGSADAEPYLVRAFELDPGNDNAFSLLENWWVDGNQWARLAETYRLRTEHEAMQGRDIATYRRAGLRLTCASSAPGLGVRILQQGIQHIFQREMEDAPELIAMLRSLIEQLVEGGATPAAVRLLAQALAHPRSDDEVMWIVNVGIALAADDVAMERTKATFQSLRERLVAEHPAVESESAAFVDIEGEVVDWLENDELIAIGDEITELTRPANLGPDVAKRIDLVADVNVILPAKLEVGAAEVEAMTRDLSATGLYLACSEPLHIGDELRLTLLMPGEDGWTLVEHEVQGVVARIEGDNGYGIRFTQVPEAYRTGLLALAEP